MLYLSLLTLFNAYFQLSFVAYILLRILEIFHDEEST